jgi:hypothetical protein
MAGEFNRLNGGKTQGNPQGSADSALRYRSRYLRKYSRRHFAQTQAQMRNPVSLPSPLNFLFCVRDLTTIQQPREGRTETTCSLLGQKRKLS